MSNEMMNLKGISNNFFYMQNSNQNPCHIRDSEYRYMYVNQAMHDLLDLPEDYDIEGKLFSEIPHWSHVFSDEFRRYGVISKSGVWRSGYVPL